jgi:hypothetical protein
MMACHHHPFTALPSLAPNGFYGVGVEMKTGFRLMQHQQRQHVGEI